VRPRGALSTLERPAWSSPNGHIDTAPNVSPLSPPPRAGRLYPVIKRAVDIVGAGTMLVATSPLIVAIALAVKLTSTGPVLFRQCRVGQFERPFPIWKFRTMRSEPSPQPARDPWAPHKVKRDPRVTPIGRVLRRTCLDELPQLWNVLVGDMSLVGPRPELPEIVDRYEPWQRVRHSVPPGLTGWWQINRDDDHLMHQATELDLYYVSNRSLRLDFEILARTAGAIAQGRGIY
jgi:lipopolysaccharide/colanic/teichoic acid biosynthesis glycosyltransferase